VHPGGSKTGLAAPARGLAGNMRLVALLARVASARHWGALSEAADQAQIGFVAGWLTAEEAEQVAEACLARSREIPEPAP